MPRFQKRYLFLVIILLLIGVCLVVVQIVHKYSEDTKNSLPTDENQSGSNLVPPDPVEQLPASPSILHRFKKGAVCTDGPPCSEIGRDILFHGGSAVDAAISALLCNGIVNQQSMGLGGGFLMTVYTKQTGEAVCLNARERAPKAASRGMFEGRGEMARKGPLSIAVPGELSGYWEAHKRFGRLPWARVVQPVVKLCRHGYNITKAQRDALGDNEEAVRKDAVLSSVFVDPSTGKFPSPGSFIKPATALCDTLSAISEYGGEVLNRGVLAEKLALDLKQMGSLITLEDLEDYQPQWSPALNFTLHAGSDKLRLLTVPPPGSGVLLGHIFNILDGYNMTSSDVTGTTESRVLMMHRVTEAFKFAYAKRTMLGDPDYIDIEQLITNLTSPQFASSIRALIDDSVTYNDVAHYGADDVIGGKNHGTAHISVVAPNGDAVSVTSTINYYFGSGLSSPSTGIVLNNCMDDFSSPGVVNYFGVPPSGANAIAPGKRAQSSMTPSIVVGGDNGDVRMVIGASGGTKITTAVALVMLRHLWLGQNLKQSVDSARFHHQLYPMEIQYEYGILDQLIQGLQAKGHKTSRYRSRGSIICALSVNNSGIFANADFRKGGDVYGL